MSVAPLPRRPLGVGSLTMTAIGPCAGLHVIQSVVGANRVGVCRCPSALPRTGKRNARSARRALHLTSESGASTQTRNNNNADRARELLAHRVPPCRFDAPVASPRSDSLPRLTKRVKHELSLPIPHGWAGCRAEASPKRGLRQIVRPVQSPRTIEQQRSSPTVASAGCGSGWTVGLAGNRPALIGGSHVNCSAVARCCRPSALASDHTRFRCGKRRVTKVSATPPIRRPSMRSSR